MLDQKGSSLKDTFLKYYSLKTGNKNNNTRATLPSAISSICCRCGQTCLMNDDKSYSRGGSQAPSCISWSMHKHVYFVCSLYITALAWVLDYYYVLENQWRVRSVFFKTGQMFTGDIVGCHSLGVPPSRPLCLLMILCKCILLRSKS